MKTLVSMLLGNLQVAIMDLGAFIPDLKGLSPLFFLIYPKNPYHSAGVELIHTSSTWLINRDDKW